MVVISSAYGNRSQKTATTVNFFVKSVCSPQTSQIGTARRTNSMITLKAVITCHARYYQLSVGIIHSLDNGTRTRLEHCEPTVFHGRLSVHLIASARNDPRPHTTETPRIP